MGSWFFFTILGSRKSKVLQILQKSEKLEYSGHWREGLSQVIKTILLWFYIILIWVFMIFDHLICLLVFYYSTFVTYLDLAIHYFFQKFCCRWYAFLCLYVLWVQTLCGSTCIRYIYTKLLTCFLLLIMWMIVSNLHAVEHAVICCFISFLPLSLFPHFHLHFIFFPSVLPFSSKSLILLLFFLFLYFLCFLVAVRAQS